MKKAVRQRIQDYRLETKAYILCFIFCVLSFVSCVIFFAGCSSTSYAPVHQPEEVFIGVSIPETGKYAWLGESARRGIELALDEINEIGGIKGTRLKALYRDDNGQPQLSGENVNFLQRQNVVAVIGGLLNATAFAGGIQANQDKIVFLTPLAGATGIPELGPYVFRNRIAFAQNTMELADYLFKTAGKRNFAVLYPKDEFGIVSAEVFSRRIKEMGGTIMVVESYDPVALDYTSDVIKICSFGPQVVFLPCYDLELLGLAQAFYQSGNRMILAGIESWTEDGVVDRGKEFLNGSIYTTSFYRAHSDQNVKNFVAKYKNRYGTQPDRVAAHCADAIRLLAHCLYTRGFDREALRDELAKVKDFPGITGITTFNGNRDADKAILLLAVRSGNIEKLQ